MKYFLLFTLTIYSLSALAVNIKPSLVDGKLYPLDYELIKIAPICPQNPHGISCKALGSTVIVKAKLSSCLDQEMGFDYKTYYSNNELQIDIIGYAKRHPMANDVNCDSTEYSLKTFTIIEQFYENVRVSNSDFETLL